MIIFNENRSFDHYFATYPNTANPPGEIPFKPDRETPTVNNLANANLLTNNPNLNPENGTGATNPFRLDRTQANTADQNHGYTAEQKAYDNGKADLFPLNTGNGTAGGVGAFERTKFEVSAAQNDRRVKAGAGHVRGPSRDERSPAWSRAGGVHGRASCSSR